MGDVMEFDMGTGRGSRGRPPPRIASRLAAGRRSSGAKSTEGPIQARPPSGRVDAKASDTGGTPSRRPSFSSADSFRTRGRDSSRRGRGSSDDEAAAKPLARRTTGSPEYGRVDPERRRSIESRSSTDMGAFRLGQKIEGQFRGKGQWYKGRIIGVNPEGKYDVRYEDGDEDLGLDASAIRSEDAHDNRGGGSRDDGRSGSTHRDSDHRGGPGAGSSRNPRIGDHVEARVPGTSRWQRATVVGENRNGTLDVHFRDGTEETRLEPSMVRPVEDNDVGSRGRADGRGAEAFRVGDEIEARYRGKSTWFKGVIRRVNSDRTYDIRYADGDQETGIDSSLIRSLDVRDNGRANGRESASSMGPASGRASGENYRAGDKVEARFGGRSRWFRGVVERQNRDGTFHIIYDDGDEEREVEKSLIRRIGSGSDDRRSGSRSPGRRVISGGGSDGDLMAHPSFQRGDKVEARYKRGRQWFVGTIRAVNRDGTYDIRYEDGDSEDGVDPGLVRKVGVGSTDSIGPASGAKRRDTEFLEGEKVEARFGGRSRWFKATVQRRNRDGSYHLVYADGDEERAVEKDLIRKVDEPERGGASKPSARRRVGDEVEARYKGGHKWYPGVIQAINRDGTFDLRYKDGDAEKYVDPSLVRAKGGASIESLASSSDGNFVRGDKVEARFGGRSRWFKATVERENRDGTFHLLYADGDEERSVDRNLIRRVGRSDGQSPAGGRAASRSRSPVSHRGEGGVTERDSDLGTKLRVGDSVEARYKRGRKWYQGTIRAINRNGTYHIRYKDGDEESDVEASMIRDDKTASAMGSSARDVEGVEEFAEGDRVEARFGGRSRWLRATVERKNRDGTYWLIYADGDEERNVDKRLIRTLGGGSGGGGGSSPQRMGMAGAARRVMSTADSASDLEPPRKAVIRANDEVEARYKGGHKWYPGVVKAVNRNGTYDVRYKDGDSEFEVDARNIRSVSTTSLGSSVDLKGRRDNEYFEGDRVEARFGGRSRWFKGKVSRANRDGTYHIVYADGDEESSVPKSLMRRLDGGGDAQESKSGNRADEASGVRKKPYRVGVEIEARYKKGRKWYPGKVQAVNGDGTYDIRYADGDMERDVEHELIRGTSAVSLDSTPTDDDFREGDKVEARFGGRSRWSKATVERKHRDGTYSLRYEDGDHERAVDKRLIRRIGTRNSPGGQSRSPGRRVVSGVDSEADNATPKVFRVGSDVEARYKRGRKWFPGVVRAVNRDGTYDIRYNDGDNEREVEPGLVRGLGMASVTSLATSTNTDSNTMRSGSRSSFDFAAGDKVEARFGGGSRWFKATVDVKNRDGTYDLLYADGDEERRVASSLIRRVEGGAGTRQGSRSPGRRVVSGAGTDSEVDPVGGTKLREGDEVEARYKKGRKYFPGVIHAVNRDGTYDIRYNDGDRERSVDRGLIRGKHVESTDSLTSSRDMRNAVGFSAGENVEARYGGRSRWFKASVRRKNRDGTYHLLYADGDEERNVEKDLIRRVGHEEQRSDDGPRSHDGRSSPRRHLRDKVNSVDSFTSNSSSYNIGDKVEARFRGKTRWFKATIERINSDGTYSLLYEDGDKERDVDKSLIRRASDRADGNEGSATERILAHRVGDEVEARYKRGRKWYPGKIRAVNEDGTYDIRYRDGDSERSVDAALVRRLDPSTTKQAPRGIDVGDKVEGRFGGGSRWYEATVERKNKDGTYWLLYTDGDVEKSVDKDFIRTLGGGSGVRNSPDKRISRTDSETATDIDQGERKYGDQGKSRGLGTKRGPPQAGDEVEARFRGGSRWLQGRITRSHRDGTFSVEYEDGRSEGNVPASHVRTLENAAPNRSSDGSDSDRRIIDKESTRSRAITIVEGDVVEARLGGRSTWHKGEVTRVHSDGTYDIRYGRDGEFEKRVDPRLVRRPVGAAFGARDGSTRGSSRGRREAESSSASEEHVRGAERGRRSERGSIMEESPSDDAKAAATKVRRALRHAEKSVDDFLRKLMRVQRGSGGRDSRGRSVAGGIDKDALGRVLAGVGVELLPHEMRELRRCCPDAQNDGCINPSTLISLVRGTGGSPTKRPRSSGSRARGGSIRRSSSIATTSGQSASESGAADRLATKRRQRARSQSRARRRNGSGSSLDSGRGSSGRDSLEKRSGDSKRPHGSSPRHKRVGQRGSDRRGEGTSSESGGSGDSFSTRGGRGDALVSSVGLTALKKLEGPAFDGGLGREFEKLGDGRHRELPTSNLKQLLRRLRVRLDGSPLEDLVTVLDPDDLGSFSLPGLLEVVLSTVEDKKVSKIHADIGEQIFKPSGRGRKLKNIQEAKAASAIVSKTMSKLEHPKGSGMLMTRNLKELLQKAGARVSNENIESLTNRLDPADRGKIDREALVVWLTSGFDIAQAESRASVQLGLLKAKKIRRPEKTFKEFDVDGQGEVRKADFVQALSRLGLVLTHGQAATLAAKHHGDYQRFLDELGDPRRRQLKEGTASEDLSSENAAEGSKRRTSWIKSLARRRSVSRRSGRRGASGDNGGSSNDSDGPLTTGPSDGGEDGGDSREEEGLLLGKRAREALRDAFERTCDTTGGVKEAFGKTTGRGSGDQEEGYLPGREQARRFLRRLKLDLAGDDLDELLDALAAPAAGGEGGEDGGASRERGVSFETDTRGKKRTKSGVGDVSDGGVRVFYRDFLELVLSEQESKEVSKIHGRMSKDLARAAFRSNKIKNKACPYGLVVNALSKHDTEGLGFVKVSDFKRSLEKLGFGGLSSIEKSLLVRRFDPVEEGMINYELFGAWLSSGLDADRLTAKLSRLLGQLKGRGGGGGRGREKTGRGERAKGKARNRQRLKGGLRGLFEAIDQDATGTVSRHHMKVVLREKLGLPLTEGDLRALFNRLDKDGDGLLDFEELLALVSKRGRDVSIERHKRAATAAEGKGSKRGRTSTDSSSDRSYESNASKGKEDRDEKKKLPKETKKKKKTEKEKAEKKAESNRGAITGRRLESKLVKLRITILQQSLAADAANDERNGGGSSDDDDHHNEKRGTTPAAITAKWTAMFEARDRAGTGKATIGDLRAILEETGVKLSADERSLLASKFAARSPGECGSHDGSHDQNDDGAEDRNGEKENGGQASPSSALIDYYAFVRWLSEGGGLDDALLGKVQRHLKARLSKAKDLRGLFTEMCAGGAGKHAGSGHDNDRTDHENTKDSLSSSRLARGLKHAGLPLDRTLVNLLVAAFSTSGMGVKGGRARRHSSSTLSYADFHRMVHCDGLLTGGFAALEAGSGGGSGTLDEQIRSTLLETVERAFAFYDEDNANSIDATEVVNILRALGHHVTRGESRALLRKANVDRSGGVQFEDFQEAVMPFLLERAHSKKLTQGEMRAMFDEIDKDRSGAIKREEFAHLFCGKLRLLSQEEAEALLSILDRHQSGEVSWAEFVELFELVDDKTGGGGITALSPDLKEVVSVALRKVQMGTMPDVEGQLSSFMGMPSSCRRSVLAPLDNIKELSLEWVLMPKLDSRGCIQLQDMSVKVTTEVAEVEANKAPPDSQSQVLVKTTNLTDQTSGDSKKKDKSATISLAATLGFGKREKAKQPAPAAMESKATKTRRRSAILGAGLMETTTTVMKRATLQEVGASTEEAGRKGRGGGRGGGSGVMQVELSVKHAYGIPVARDSRMGDIRQRGMRACLFYDAGSEVDKDTGEATSEYSEHFLCNTYKTLAIQHPQKEEQWLFPDSAEGERKFLVRTDFGSGGGGKSRQDRRQSGGRNRNHHQGTGDESSPPQSSFRGDRKRLFLLVELTCTVQTPKEGTAAAIDSYGDGLAVGGRRRLGGGSGDGVVRGPLKNFRVSEGGRGRGGHQRRRGKRRVGGIREKGSGTDDDESSSYSVSGENSSESEYSKDSQRGEGDSETASASSSNSGGGRKKRGVSRRQEAGDLKKGRVRGNNKKNRKDNRGGGHRRHHNDGDGSTSSTGGSSDGNGHSRSSSDSGSSNNSRSGKNKNKRLGRGRLLKSDDNRKKGEKRGRKKNTRSAPPSRRGRTGRVSRGRKGVRSEGPRGERRRRHRNNRSDLDDDDESRSGESGRSSTSRGKGRGGRGAGRKSQGRESGRGGWRRGWRGRGGQNKARRRHSSLVEAARGEGDCRGDMVEVEMSCGWVLIPFLELAEAHEVKRVRYKLLGGTPFAKTDIDEDEVMTRRYGWRAVLKAMKIEGMHKGSEVEIKILPVNTLPKLKQEDIFRLPRNVILSDTFVSLVRHYREYAANSLAKRMARGMGNVGFGAGSASSEPVLALFPRLAADPALMTALKSQWEAEVRKSHVDGRLGATITSKLVDLGFGGRDDGDGNNGVGLVGVTGAAREACLLTAFEKAVMQLWPAYCHIDAQRGRATAREGGAESYEELESRGQRIRHILDNTDSFHSDTPSKVTHGEEGGGGWRGGGGGNSSSAVSQEGRVMVAFTLKEVAFDVA